MKLSLKTPFWFGFLMIPSLLLLQSCATKKIHPEEFAYLVHARLVDPDQEKVFSGNVVIHNGQVESISEGVIPGAFEGDIYDLGDQYLLPAFADLHIHSWGSSSPDGKSDEIFGPEKVSQAYLIAGVTSVLDLGSKSDDVFSFRDHQRMGQVKNLGADFYAAGDVFGATSSNGMRALNTVAQTDEEIRTYIESRNPDVIKVIYGAVGNSPSILPAVLNQAIKTAHRFYKKVIVHISSWEDAKFAIKAGADVITHFADHQELKYDTINLFRKKGIIMIPTMAVQSDLRQINQNPDLLDEVLLKKVASAELIESYRHPDTFSGKAQEWLKAQKQVEENDRHSMKLFQDYNVQLLVGSDSGNLGTFHGFSTHREMQLWAESGIPIWNILRSATTKAQTFVGKRVCLEVGCAADFTILSKNPTTEIKNTRSVSRVILHGQWVGEAPQVHSK